ncbi:M17 family peptidase N-terminal domain-containing protein [Sphingomonas sp. BIUV-7]|uniref:M17 family peptidase N-terminal domain-containing protein n=1 Tax=Sphingomonas natans TaxID=3063330 RepID=A0ABT8Y7A3_9SPHN|nr:M17 family peptidase N-terminal domain-containing protein [Sphingomonas sp. BIUV-7]MDO6414206.1 M17 family peptidase N-terminal domain-containing protein [Sphingomonas sp. BIUV-7]
MDKTPLPAAGDVAVIGEWQDFQIDVIAGDLSTTEADILVAAICGQLTNAAQLGPGIAPLDRALRGALARLRSDGIFSGRWGETLFLSAPPPPINAAGVLMLGLGPTGPDLQFHLRRALRSAADHAAGFGAAHAAFGPANLDTGSPRFNDIATARSLLRGVLDICGLRPGKLQRWSFVAPPTEFEVTADKYRMALEGLTDH